MANRRIERVPLPAAPQRVLPASNVQGVPMLSVDGLAHAASQDDGSAEVFMAASQTFGRVASTIGQIADQAAAREGEQAGALAGMDREFRPRGDGTIYSRAYDGAGLQTFKSKMSVDVTAQMQKAFDENQGNPEGLGAAFEAIKAGWQETADKPALAPHIKPEFEALFNRNAIGFMRQATREFHERQDAQLTGALEAERETRTRTAEQQAFRLGLDETADQVLAGELTDLRKRLAVVGYDGKPIVAPATQVKVLRDTETGIARARVMGAFSRLPDLQARSKFISDLEAKYQAGGDRVLDLFEPEQYHALIGTLTAAARTEELGAAQATRQLTRQLKDFGDQAKKGIALSDADMSGLKARVASSGKPELVEAFDEAIETLGTVRQLNTMPPAQIEAWVDQEGQRQAKQGASLTTRDASRLELARGYLKNAHTELATDMLGFAAKAGTATVAPINLTDPSSLAQRDEVAQHAAAFYGRPVQRFRPEEKAALAAVSRKGGDEMLAVASSIATGFKDNAPAALSEIFDEAPATAMLGGLVAASGVTPLARDAATGFAYRSAVRDEKGGGAGKFYAPSAKEAREAAHDVFGDTFAEMPKSEAAAIEIANAAYETRAQRLSKVEFDPELYKSTLRETLGERTIGGEKYGGLVNQSRSTGWWSASATQAIVIPPDVKQAKWNELIDVITAGDLDRAGLARPVDGAGKAMPTSAIRAGILVPIGDGKYAVAMGDPRSPGEERWLMSNPNRDEKFVLDMKMLEPTLRKRRPDLYLGGR
jgi:hypothetical protein